MPGCARLGDQCQGHGCYPPRKNCGASPDTNANNRRIHRQGDPWLSHGCSSCSSHGAVLAGHSPTIFVNNKGAGRCGDKLTCPTCVGTCSSDVIFDS